MFRPAGILAPLLLGLLPAASAAAEPQQPLNVLLIAVDDLNTSLACYGHPLVRSPHTDALAARGVRFERAYCQYPLCNPSRTSLLSGRRPDTTAVLDNNTPPRSRLGELELLPEYFQRHGYFTARAGKIAHGTYEGAVRWSPLPAAGGAGCQAQGEPPERPARVGRLDWRAADGGDDQQPDGRVAQRIVALLAERRQEPFFLAAGFHKPHLPLVAPQKYFAPYPAADIPLPDEPAEHLQSIPRAALTLRREDLQLTAAEKQRVIAAYYACVSFTDAQMGRLLEALTAHQLWERTVVVLWGDHGWHLGEHGGLWRKLTLFEQSARVPLLVVAPGRARGQVSPRLVELVDLYPTLVELCGLPRPEGLEGTSFVPLLDDPARAWKSAAFTQVNRGRGVMGRSLRTERFRYTEWGDPNQAELYDHQVDPRELRNLASDPDHSATRETLRQQLAAGPQAALPPR